MYQKHVKRILDILCALLALIFFGWLYLLIALLVRLKLGSPVLFRQARPGKDEKIFWMYKFRTMTDARDEKGKLLSDEARLTRFGELLRSTSLDELPEAFNILRGEMSIVGPRPQLVRDMVFMTPEQRQRHSVRPGLTGLAQVSGRNAISWEKKLAIDLEYLRTLSFWTDLKIVGKTVTKFLSRSDINTEGMATAEDFGDYLLRIGEVDQNTYEQKQQESQELIARSKQ